MKSYKEAAELQGIQHTFDILKVIDFETAVNITTAEKYLLNELNSKLFEKLINNTLEYICFFEGIYDTDKTMVNLDDFNNYKSFCEDLSKMGYPCGKQSIYEYFNQ
jgi:hypothetical protein